MLKKSDRLTTEDIEVLSQGKSVFGTLISMRFSPSPEKTNKTKISVAVSKKVAPRAVDRNKIRRRTYAVVGDLIQSINKNTYILLTPKKDFLTLPRDVLCRETKALFEKARLFEGVR